MKKVVEKLVGSWILKKLYFLTILGNLNREEWRIGKNGGVNFENENCCYKLTSRWKLIKLVLYFINSFSFHPLFTPYKYSLGKDFIFITVLSAISSAFLSILFYWKSVNGGFSRLFFVSSPIKINQREVLWYWNCYSLEYL